MSGAFPVDRSWQMKVLHGKLWDSPLISHASRASFPPGGSLRNLAFPLRGRWIAKGETDEVFFIPQETVKNQNLYG